MTTQITPENVGIRPYTAEEYVARSLDHFGGYDMGSDPKLQSVALDYSKIWDYQIAIAGQNPEEVRADILESIARIPVAQTACIDGRPSGTFDWA